MKKTTLKAFLYLSIINTLCNAQTVLEIDGAIEQKRLLSIKDYELWETIDQYYLSDSGDWCSYARHKKNKTTLIIASTQGDLKYNFSDGYSVKFNSGSQWAACVVRKKGLGLLNLEAQKSPHWISGVTQFEFSPDGDYLIYAADHKTDAAISKKLTILNLKTKKEHVLTGIEGYQLSPDSKKLAYIQNVENKKSVKLISLGKATIETIVENGSYGYKNLVWSAGSTALAFFEERLGVSGGQNAYKIYCYKKRKGKSKLYGLDLAENDNFFPGRKITGHKLGFSPKELKIYFKVQGSEDRYKPIYNEDDVEVWKATDKHPGPKSYQKNTIYSANFASWHPETGKTAILETDALPKALVGNQGRYMLSYDPLQYEPDFSVTGKHDIYLTDLKTGMVRLILKQFGGEATISPNSKYISYFKDKHWWVYSIEKNTHTNVTKHLAVTWHRESSKHPHKNGLKPYGSAGWTKGDKQLVVYDKYDVWMISPTGESQRLTNGRSSQIRYRIHGKKVLYKGQIKSHITVFTGGFDDPVRIGSPIDLSNGLTFHIEGVDKASGYAIWKPGKKVQILVYKPMRISDLIKASDKDVYIYVEQSFKTAPRIVYLNKKDADSKILAASNTHQKQFHWGHSELVYYKGLNGEDLQGALFYPANYKPGKKYPMIVEIYERLSKSLHKYINPSEYQRSRLNRTHYTASGYFVFHPDINYTYNNVGMSAVHCVEAGVKAVIAKGVVEEDRIGLNGHSFGGYQTNFIITQSNLFATAVAGASVSDIVSIYHLGKMKNFEDWQFVFKGSFYENREAYLYNSPIQHLANVRTPLLLWTGKKDASVDYRQSFQMFYGLHRLNKPCELLVYPDEGHDMMSTKNMLDLSRRTKAWFDKYLKPEPALENKNF